jgi:hypothetical protein
MLSQRKSKECKRILTMLRRGKAEGVVTDFTIILQESPWL